MARNDQLLTIDYSTASTGWALFDIDSKSLLDYGIIAPQKVKGLSAECDLKKTLNRLKDLANQISDLIEINQPKIIAIEQINRGCNRLAQKTLDGGHWILLNKIERWLPRVTFIDSDGKTGWRKHLNLILSEDDKKANALHKKLNKSAKRGEKLPIFTKKDLCQRFVNEKYNLNFDVQKNSEDSDVCDAIGLGTAFLDIKK